MKKAIAVAILTFATFSTRSLAQGGDVSAPDAPASQNGSIGACNPRPISVAFWFWILF